MKISLATSGGLTAGAYLSKPRPPLVLEVGKLAVAEKAELLKRLAAAAAEAKSQATRESRGADLMSYSVSVDDGDRSFVLKQSDSGMPHGFAKLLDWLQAHFSANK
jgi:hypothetical protein